MLIGHPMSRSEKGRPIFRVEQGRRVGIANFHLFGEDARSLSDRFFHIERIGDRSSALNGLGPAHRHNSLHQICLWSHCCGRYMFDGSWHDLPSCALTFVPAGTVHAFDGEAVDDTIVLSLSEAYLLDCLRGANGLLLPLARTPQLFELGEADHRELLANFELCERDFSAAGPLSSEAIAAYVRLAFIRLTGMALRINPATMTVGHQLTQRFYSLLDKHHAERWSVTHYADALGITPYILNGALRRCTGQRAAELMRERFAAEAKRLLIFTDLSIADIAYSLGYEDTSHFSRAFRDTTHSTPTEVRQAAQGTPA